MLAPVQWIRVALVLALAACAPSVSPPRTSSSQAEEQRGIAPPADARSLGSIHLVESVPVETDLDHLDIPDAPRVWFQMVHSARATIDIAQFYVSDNPTWVTAFTAVLSELRTRASAGVKVRLMVEEKFFSKYPESIERLVAAGVVVKRITRFNERDGILHAKYFIVDGKDAFVGSQNFDWRALMHIQEIGVRVQSEAFATRLTELFELDWNYPEGQSPTATATSIAPTSLQLTAYGAPAEVTLAASPKGALLPNQPWELPKLIALLDGAKRSIHLQVLTYATHSRYGGPFFDLQQAMKRAAARGVHVNILVSSWMRNEDGGALRELAALPNISVKVITIPEWSGGAVPFARVSHAKYMTVDGTEAWVGSSNWEGNYFTASRNVGVFVTSTVFAQKLDSVFESGWESPLSTAW